MLPSSCANLFRTLAWGRAPMAGRLRAMWTHAPTCAIPKSCAREQAKQFKWMRNLAARPHLEKSTILIGLLAYRT